MVDFVNPDEGYCDGGLSAPITIDDNDFHMSNTFSIDSNINLFAQQPSFLGSNDDLNSFFSPGLNGQDKCMALGQWDNGEEMQVFGDQPPSFPFPFQVPQMQQQRTIDTHPIMDATWSGSKYKATQTEQPVSALAPAEEQLGKPEEVTEKPKRGRPRKRKRKDPLSEAEKQKKREAFLERNRRAASKCRKRKKESTESIQSRANQLEKQSQLLALELMEVREEHARWLAMIIEHAKACPDNSLFQEYLREVEERMANFSAQISLARTLNWADFQPNGVPELYGSSVSGTTSSPRDDAFDPSEFCDDDQLLENTISQPILDNDNSVSLADFQHSAQSRSVSSSEITRKNSSSSISTSSNKHSSCTSFRTTPEADNSNEDTVMTDPLVMLRNQRIAQPSKAASGAIEKKLRSGKTIASGGPTEDMEQVRCA